MNSRLYFSTKNHWVNSPKYDGLLFIGNTNSFLRLIPLHKEMIDNNKFDDLPKDLYEELQKSKSYKLILKQIIYGIGK